MADSTDIDQNIFAKCRKNSFQQWEPLLERNLELKSSLEVKENEIVQLNQKLDEANKRKNDQIKGLAKERDNLLEKYAKARRRIMELVSAA